MKKGFTLIELLAVIVILAIIALIATPIVINIINDAKESSDEQSVELYKDAVEKAITKKQLSNPNFNPDKCKIQENGNLKCYKNNELLQDEIEVDMKGKMPSSGIVIIEGNKLKFINIIFNGNKYYELTNLVEDNGNSGLSIGDKYTYKVNDKDTFNFYVLSLNNDNTVNLIMDRNICGFEDRDNLDNGRITDIGHICPISWYSEFNNRKGPITAMIALYNATKNWSNVSNMDLSGDKAYKDEGNLLDSRYGYGKIETTLSGIKITDKDGVEIITESNKSPTIPYDKNKYLKARMPNLKETLDAGCYKYSSSEDYGTCPIWLIGNLRYFDVSNYAGSEYTDKYAMNRDGNVNQNIVAYWLMSSKPGDSGNAYDMDDTGNVGSFFTYHSINYGIRPVITVPKSYLES